MIDPEVERLFQAVTVRHLSPGAMTTSSNCESGTIRRRVGGTCARNRSCSRRYLRRLRPLRLQQPPRTFVLLFPRLTKPTLRRAIECL